MTRAGMPIIFIAGDMLDREFHECKLIAEDLPSLDSRVSSEIRPMVEDAWLEYIASKRRAFGGKAVDHKTGPLVVHSSLGYLGSLDEFLGWAIKSYGYTDPRSTPEYGILLEELDKLAMDSFATYTSSRSRKMCYLDVQFGMTEETHRMTFELYDDKCPKTVENFLALCSGENGTVDGKKLAYKDTKIHRVVKGAWIQGGDIGSGKGGTSECVWGGVFPDESLSFQHDQAGILSMANSGPHTNGSQFFVTMKPLPCFDGKYVAFGKMKTGFKVLEMFNNLNTSVQRPLENIKIADCGLVGDAFYASSADGSSKGSEYSPASADSTTKAATVLILGVDNAGKSTIQTSLEGDPNKPIIPTLGLERGFCTSGETKVTMWGLGGGAGIRTYWSTYFDDIHGVIFCVDASDQDRLEESKKHFAEVAAAEKVQGKPIAIFCNKQDLKNCLSAAEVALALGVDVDSDLVKVFTTTALVKEGGSIDPNIIEGMAWMCGAVDKQMPSLGERVKSDIESRKEAEKKIKAEKRRAVEERKKAEAEKAASKQEIKS